MPTYDSALSTEVNATTTLPAPTLDSVTTGADSADLAWTATHTNGNTRVEYRDADDTAWIVDQTVPYATETATISGINNGTTHDFRVVADTTDAESPSNVLTDTTTLPGEDQPVLGNGIKDEIAVDRETAVSNAGDVRYQLRRTEDAPDWDTAASFQEFIGTFDTLIFEFVGLLDGEEYEVRGRTETADVTGAWTAPVSIVTKFPGFQNFRIDSVGETSVTLAWEDFADNEDGTRVQRRAEVNGTFGPWETIDTLAPTGGEGTTVAYDAPLPPNTTAEFRIEPFTPYTSATSNALEATTGGGGQDVSAGGYHVEVVHPTTGRVRVPEVVDLQNAPVFNPGPNAQPVVRVPVRKNDVWLSDAYDDDPTMRVWRDGRRLPIEVLRDVEQLEGASVLIGVGGIELEQRVREEYDDDRRHLAVRDLVETKTTYGNETPAPDTATLTDVVQSDVDSNAEWVDALAENITNDSLYEVQDGTLRRRQTAYFAQGDNLNDVRGTEAFGDSTWVSEDIWFFDDALVNGIEAGSEATFSVDHNIPSEDIRVAARIELPADQGDGTAYHQAYTQRVNGDELDPRPADIEAVKDPPEWNIYQPASGGVADLTPGDVDVEIKMTGDSADPNNAEFGIDAIMLYDARSPPALIDAVTQDSKAQVDFYNGSSLVETRDFQTAFTVAAGDLTATYNTTAGDQRVGISNDSGVTWTDATNSQTVTTDFSDPSSNIRVRFEVGGVAGETANAVGQVDRHEVDAYTLLADISQELLLIEEVYDNDLASVLTSIGEPAERSWGLTTDANGDIVVRFVQNGQFDAAHTPDVSDRTREKLGKTYDSVLVKGSNEPESNIPYTASTSFEALPRDNILAGSETVYDDTRNYDRGDDYEINYQAGELRATSGGDLVVGDAYRVDFRYQARGTFESPDAPADPDELVTTVPGVTSTRLAEQVAFVLASEVDTPRYAAEVVIPDPDPRFDPTDALPPGALGLPSGIDSLEVRGEPQLTETGLAVRFGTRPPVEATQQRLSRQLGRVSDRS